MKKQVTVSLLNIDQAAITIDVLDKLAALSAANWEIQLILVDNGSQADQLQLLQDWVAGNKSRFEETLFVAASRNLGCTGGRNLAFKLASRDRILILDNDLILPDESAWLEKLWQRMDSNPKAAIVAPMLVFADRPETVQATGIGLTEDGRVGYIHRGRAVTSVSPNLIEVIAAPTACWLVRKEAQQEVGLFLEIFYPVQYEDVDLCVRLHLAGWKTLCDCSVQMKHMENVTTRNLTEHPFARLTVRNGMTFKEKWAELLPQLATITPDEISWEASLPIQSTETR
jgi:GT2 family glycosyltransferase